MPRLITGERVVVRDETHVLNGLEGIAKAVGEKNALIDFGRDEISIPLSSLKRIVDSATDVARHEETMTAFKDAFAVWEKLGSDVDRKRAEVIAVAADRAGVPVAVADGLKYVPMLQKLDLPSPWKEIIGALVTALVVAARGYGLAAELFELVDDA